MGGKGEPPKSSAKKSGSAMFTIRITEDGALPNYIWGSADRIRAHYSNRHIVTPNDLNESEKKNWQLRSILFGARPPKNTAVCSEEHIEVQNRP